MKFVIPARLRLVGGLISVLISVMLIAMTLGLIPDTRTAVLESRARLCETLAINSSVFVSIRAHQRLEEVLRATVKRDPSILSIGVRERDGDLVIDIGGHDERWKESSEVEMADSGVQVPIFRGKERWGRVEVRFQPLETSGILGFLAHPVHRLIIFVAGTCFLVYLLFLGRVLRQLDPGRVVPQRVRSALDTLAEGLLLMDKNERIVLANASFSRTVGEDPEKLQGRRASTLPWFDQDSGASPADFAWSRAISSKTPQESATLGLETPEHGRRIFVVHSTPIQGDDDKVRGALASFEDVTPLEEKKVELSAAREQAEDANRAKSDFLARMSHEIRTPMNAILGFSDVLYRGMARDEKQRNEYIEKIRASGLHLLELINDILDLSKIESGKMEFEFLRCPTRKLIHDVISVLKVKAEEKGIRLEYRSEGPVPESILSDPTRLKQILINLIGNAIKFTDRGGVQLVARLEEGTARPRLVIDIIDTGVGIPADKVDRVFEAFSQADTTITRHFGGTGLGLSISRQLAHALGGELSVKSVYGEGSTFTVTVATGPLEDIPLVELEMSEGSVERGPEARAVPNSLAGRHILVADDGESNRDLIQLILERAGAEVEAVGNGLVALEQAREHRFDAILLDMEMPVMDGYTAATKLREMGLDIPIFALTAHAMKGAEERCRAAGCSGYLTKPIDMDEVVETIARATPGSGGSSRRILESLEARGPGVPEGIAGDRRSEPGIPGPEGQEELTSTLPTSDPRMLAIVGKFIVRLREDLEKLEVDLKAGDLDAVRQVAHRIKGSGGMAGFDGLTEPAATLEEAARRGDLEATREALEILRGIILRIRIPEIESV